MFQSFETGSVSQSFNQDFAGMCYHSSQEYFWAEANSFPLSACTERCGENCPDLPEPQQTEGTVFDIWLHTGQPTSGPLRLRRQFSHGMRRWFLWRKMYHAWLFYFFDGLGGGNDPLNFQNRAIAGFWENARFIRSNGRKTTFEWPKVVSEVSFLRFWGVLSIAKCFRFFVSVIGSAVSEI